LPAQLYLGTSSWAFPGWQGLVYDRPASSSVLAQHGLAAYAQHPLLRTVCLDRTFYAPISAADYADYAAVVPDAFRMLVKAHAWCTQPVRRESGRSLARRQTPNEVFLQPAYAIEHVVEPYRAGLGAKAGPLLFQFSPMDVRALGGPQQFAQRLHTFLAALPYGPLYAVEVRNAALLCPAYAQALADLGVCHCYNVHPSMPSLREQQRLVPLETMPALLVRWSLHPGQRYEAAKTRYEPFDRLIDADLENRQAIAALCLTTLAAGRPAFVTVNNKAEGSAPRTVLRLAEAIGRSLVEPQPAG
jgi:uncharacterized protein YecE (DUF72 family)